MTLIGTIKSSEFIDDIVHVDIFYIKKTKEILYVDRIRHFTRTENIKFNCKKDAINFLLNPATKKTAQLKKLKQT
jgi:hypothetical protein